MRCRRVSAVILIAEAHIVSLDLVSCSAWSLFTTGWRTPLRSTTRGGIMGTCASWVTILYTCSGSVTISPLLGSIDRPFLAPLLLREAGNMVCYLISSLPACIPVIHSRSKPRRRQYISSAVLLNTTHVHSVFPKNNLSTAIRICLPFHYHFSSSLSRTTFIHSRSYMPACGRASSRRNTV
jgi:hypothetical protein